MQEQDGFHAFVSVLIFAQIRQSGEKSSVQK